VTSRSASASAARAADFTLLSLCAALAAAGAPPPLLSAALLVTEARLLALHAWPLLPLLSPAERAEGDPAFAAAYTTPIFFGSELLLIALLAAAPSPVRAAAPHWLLGAHCAAHAAFAAFAAAAPGWSAQQNVERVGPLRRGAWQSALNALNAADLAAHCFYTAALLSAFPAAAPLAAAAAGGAAGGLRCARARAPPPPAPALAGRTVVVTGAGGGVGAALCARLAQQGALVWPLGRAQCDLASPAAVRLAAARLAREQPGGVHVLICCAAAAPWGEALYTADGRELAYAVNVEGHAALAAALLPALAAGAAASGRPSRILIVGSPAARWPGAAAALRRRLANTPPPPPPLVAPWAVYAGSKRGAEALAAAIAADSPRGIQALAVRCGPAPSGIQREMGALGWALRWALHWAGCSCEEAAAEVSAAAERELGEGEAGAVVERGGRLARACEAEEEEGLRLLWAAARAEARAEAAAR